MIFCTETGIVRHALDIFFLPQLLMMGIFATYAGFLYNDFFSLGVDLFGSHWVRTEDHEFLPDWDITNSGKKVVEDLPKPGDKYTPRHSGPYPFGVDPVWHGANNELNMMNSMKMKISVLIGVSQMVLGLMLRLTNCIFERNRVDFAFEFVPMIILRGSWSWENVVGCGRGTTRSTKLWEWLFPRGGGGYFGEGYFGDVGGGDREGLVVEDSGRASGSCAS